MLINGCKHFTVPPRILNSDSSSDMDVEEGSDITLSCKATGVPQPNITWFWKSLMVTEGKESRYNC